MQVRPAGGEAFETEFPVVIIGGGACGLTAALTARDAGIAALVLERDSPPVGSTARSSGFIPACQTRWQQARGVDDSVELMAGDIQDKAKHLADPAIVDLCCRRSGPTLEWLAERLGPDTYVNVMDQYRPAGKVSEGRFKEIGRPVTTEEFAESRRYARSLGLRLDERWNDRPLLRIVGAP